MARKVLGFEATSGLQAPSVTRHLPEQTRREQILAAARKCFIERGYHPTRMEDIASTAGLSKGGVYFHFESKRDVFDALVKEEFERSMEMIREVTGSPAPAAEKMQVVARYFVENFAKTPDNPRFFIVMGEMGLRDDQLAKHLLEMQRQFIQEIATVVAQGVKEGIFRPVDPVVVSTLMKAMMDGVEGLHALQYPLDMGQALATAMEMFMTGLVVR